MQLVFIFMFCIASIVAGAAGCTSIFERARAEQDCISDQLRLYGDLCAESSSGYEEMSGSDAHFEGVKCAVVSIKICQGVE